MPIISSVVANCSRSAQTLSSQPSTRRPTCAATMPTATSAAAKPRLNTRTVTRPSTTRPVESAASRIANAAGSGNSSRDAERHQHCKPRPFARYEIEAMRVPSAPAVAVPDHPVRTALVVLVAMVIRTGSVMRVMVRMAVGVMVCVGSAMRMHCPEPLSGKGEGDQPSLRPQHPQSEPENQ